MAITMTELAARLGLSQSTVSLVLSNRDKGRVRPELAERIRAAAREIGYRPNRAAAELRKRCSKTIGVAMAYSKNIARAEMVMALHMEIIRHGYIPLFSFFHRREEQQNATDLLLENQLAAIITIEPALLPDHLNIPVVSIQNVDPRFDAVVVDSEGGLRATLAYLKQLGHHKIGWVGMHDADLRSRLLPGLAREYQLELPDEFNVRTPAIYDDLEEFRCLRPWSQIPRVRWPDAILCHNDTVALYVQRYLHDIGLRVPDDIGLIGNDNLSFCDKLAPSLSSISYGSSNRVAEILLGMILERLRDPALPRRVETLPAQLIPRETLQNNHREERK